MCAYGPTHPDISDTEEPRASRRPVQEQRWLVFDPRNLLPVLAGASALITASIAARFLLALRARPPAAGPERWLFDLGSFFVGPFKGFETAQPVKDWGVVDLPALMALDAALAATAVLCGLALFHGRFALAAAAGRGAARGSAAIAPRLGAALLRSTQVASGLAWDAAADLVANARSRDWSQERRAVLRGLRAAQTARRRGTAWTAALPPRLVAASARLRRETAAARGRLLPEADKQGERLQQVLRQLHGRLQPVAAAVLNRAGGSLAQAGEKFGTLGFGQHHARLLATDLWSAVRLSGARRSLRFPSGTRSTHRRWTHERVLRRPGQAHGQTFSSYHQRMLSRRDFLRLSKVLGR
jgi:hypothetical protein